MKAMARMRVADVIVETLQAAGVQHCWGVPGDTLNYVTDAIRRSKIKFLHREVVWVVFGQFRSAVCC
jgi:glyoxylate carboligase